jgi:hypothetical protein
MSRLRVLRNSVPVHMESAAKGSLVKWTGTPLIRSCGLCDIKTFWSHHMNATERLLIVVTDVFEISGRGICPLPVVPHVLINPESGEPLRPGDDLELRKPDGSVTKVKLYGPGWPAPSKGGLCIELGPTVTKRDVPIGTEIWRVAQ